ncbi:MAG: large conductance mechanosensitive channel protein MscL [Bdellovibrionaceae bacterium]|nr:large conductance mechanosensitive channel protein MscL [Bdellovibrio sp.]
MLQDFKKFISQGNIMDLAIGVIIAAAFGKIITSLVNDIIMPIAGLAMNGVNVAGQFIALNGQHYATLEEARKANAGVLAYGAFIQNIIDFIIVGFVLFLIVRQLAKINRPAPVIVVQAPPNK